MKSYFEISRLLQDKEPKQEALESAEFNVEGYDFINYVKKEPNDHNDQEPIRDEDIRQLEQRDDLIKIEKDPTFSTQKLTDKTYNDDTYSLQTKHENNPLKVLKSIKSVTLQVRIERKINCCKMCKRTFFSTQMVKQHQLNAKCKPKPYHCHLCERSYSEENIFSMHQVIVHGNNHTVTNNGNTKYEHSKPTVPENRNCNNSSSKPKPLRLRNIIQNSSDFNRVFSSTHNLKIDKNHSFCNGSSSTPKSLNVQNILQNCLACNRIFSSKHNLNIHKNHSLIHKVNSLVQKFKVT